MPTQSPFVSPRTTTADLTSISLDQEAVNEIKRKEREERIEENTTFMDKVGAMASQSSIGAIDRFMSTFNEEVDPDWVGAPVKKEVKRWVKMGLDPSLLTKSVSKDHADKLYGIELVNKSAAQDISRMSTVGQLGIGLISDPVMVAADFLSGGLAYSANAARLGNLVRSGLVAAGENAGATEAASVFNPNIGGNDILANAVMGFAMGGAFGFRMGEHAALTDSVTKMSETVKQATGKAKNDSMGAARVEGAHVSTMDIPERTATEKEQMRMDEALATGNVTPAFLRLRWGEAARAAKSKAKLMQWYGRKMLREAVGYKDKSAAVERSAEEIAKELRETIGRSYWDVANKAWHTYRKEHGIWATDATAHKEFFESLGKYMRGAETDVDPLIKEAASHVDKATSGMLDELKRAGVPGFEDVSHQSGWLPRLFDQKGFEDVFETKAMNFDDVVHQLVMPSMRRAWAINGDEIDEDVLETVARAWLDRAREKATNMRGDHAFSKGIVDVGDLEHIEDLLRERGLKETEIYDTMLKLGRKEQEKSKNKHAKHRIDMDESFGAHVRSRDTRETHHITIAQLLDNNVNTVLDNYIREMSGWVALKRKLGVGSQNELEGLRSQMEREVTTAGYDKSGIDSQMRTFDIAANSVLGRSTEDTPHSAISRTSRMLRDYAHLLYMGQVGFTQLAEIGAVLAHAGIRVGLKAVPSVPALFKRMQSGEFSSKTARMFADVGPFGGDWTRHPSFLRHDDIGSTPWADTTLVGKALNKVDNAQQTLKRAQSVMSGMAPITAFLQRWAYVADAMQMLELANKPRISKTWTNRLRNHGLSEVDQKSLFGALKGMKNVDELADAYEHWDVDLKETFSAYINRVTSHQVIEGSTGTSHRLMHSSVGKPLLQFRGFMTYSYEEHLLNGLHMRDWQTMVMMAGSAMTASMGYSARAYLNTIGEPERRKKELSLDAIVKSGIQLSSWSSILPALVDTGALLANQDPMFAYGRSSGLPSNFITGIPVMGIADNIAKMAQLPGELIDEGRGVTRQEVSAILRSGYITNVTGVRNAIDAVARRFPEDED